MGVGAGSARTSMDTDLPGRISNPQESIRNADSKEKAALWAAEPLVVGFSCKVEAQFRDFSIAAFKELVYAPGNEVFVNLDFDCLCTEISLYPLQGC